MGKSKKVKNRKKEEKSKTENQIKKLIVIPHTWFPRWRKYDILRKFWLGGAAPQTLQFLAGRAKPPLKRSFVTFDRGGQTGPPRSNDVFFRRR